MRWRLLMLGLGSACNLAPAERFDAGEPGPACPGPPALAPRSYRVDSSCSPADCAVTITRTGCRIELDFQSSPLATYPRCGFGEGRALLDAAGSTTAIEVGAQAECTSVLPPSGAVASFSCALCRLDFYAPTSLERPVERIQLLFPSPAVPIRPVDTAIEVAGYTGNYVRLTDRVMIATTQVASSYAVCSSTTASTTLVTVDLVTRAVIDRTPAPPCLTVLERDPSGSTIYGVHWNQGWQLGRFTEAGNLVDVRALPVADAQPIGWIDLHAADGALYLSGNVELPDGAPLLLRIPLDPQGAIEVLPPISRPAIFGLLADGPSGTLFLGNSRGSRIEVIDLSSRTVSSGFPVPSSRFNNSQSGPVHDAPDGQRVVLSDGSPSAVLFLEGTSFVGETSYYETRALSHALAGRPGSRIAWVSATTHDGSEARLARLHLRERRFLPGSVLVGTGPISFAFEEGGAIWALLPATGELVRVEVGE